MTHLLPPFTHALLRRPAPNFADWYHCLPAHLGPARLRSWQFSNTKSTPSALRDCGLALTVLASRRSLSRRALHGRPLCRIFRELAFHLPLQARRLAAGRRRIAETAALRSYGMVEAPAERPNIDGGDVLVLRGPRLGRHFETRTNRAGFVAPFAQAAVQTVRAVTSASTRFPSAASCISKAA